MLVSIKKGSLSNLPTVLVTLLTDGHSPCINVLIGSNGAVPASEKENGDPVVGLAVHIVEIIATTYLAPASIDRVYARVGSKAQGKCRTRAHA